MRAARDGVAEARNVRGAGVADRRAVRESNEIAETRRALTWPPNIALPNVYRRKLL